jgi:hypothetical protein
MRSLFARLALVPVGMLTLAFGADGLAAETPEAERRTVTVAVAPEFAVSGFYRLAFGEGYRKLWSTPITVPVLDLAGFGGGLTPVKQRGRFQTLGLGMVGADGQEYKFRSLRKEPERVLPVEWRDAAPGKIVRDHTSATHPGAALILPAFADAIGILRTEQRLVQMPDDPALGQFRETFAGHVGTIERLAKAGPGVAEPFKGATEILKTDALWQRWLTGPENRVDSRTFLRARVLDRFVENYDRHQAQWRWVRLPEAPLWQPLSEDPDMAFVRNEGLVFDSMRNRAPRLVKFGPKFHKRLEGPTSNGAELDRWLLSDLDRASFEAVVRDTQSRFTDDVIDAGLRNMPPEWQKLSSETLASALRSRRERLFDHLMHYYRDLAQKVDVHASDRDETVSVRRVGRDAVEVEVTETGSATPYFQRRFVAAETREVRIYLHGGNDTVKTSGPAGGPIRVHVLAGGGRDFVDDSASGGTDVWAWDGAGALEVQPGPGTRRHAAWTNPLPNPEVAWVEPRNFGRWTTPVTQLMYATELELIFGIAVSRTSWGFRSVPSAAQQDFSAVWATGEKSGRVDYTGTFRRPGSKTAFRIEGLASGIERTNFFGYGNESVRPDERSEYRTQENTYTLAPSLRFERSPKLELHLGLSFRLSDTPTDVLNVLNLSDTYGRGQFSEAGLRAGVSFDTRGRLVGPVTSGLMPVAEAKEKAPKGDFRIEVSGFYVPAILDAERHFGGFEGEAAGYLGRASSRAQLAARVGGRAVFGDYPWFEAAFLGGRSTLRGYSRGRFAGDSSIYGGLDLRLWLATLPVPPIPMRFGVVGFSDVGRVFLEGESSRKWHPSWGGGVMLQPVATPFVITAAVARSQEKTTRWYFGSGYFF